MSTVDSWTTIPVPGTELAQQVEDGQPEGSEGGQRGQGLQVLQEHLGQRASQGKVGDYGSLLSLHS